MAGQPTRRCIISRGPLRSRQFTAALQASLAADEHLEIIIDRRRGGSSVEPYLKEDRRRRQVALALEVNGFAIVPASVDLTEDRTLPSLLRFEAPIERSSPADNEDEERLERIPSFQRRRPGALIPRLVWVFSGVALAVFVLSLGGEILWQTLFPARTEEPVVARTPSPARPNRESPSAGGTASTRPESPRDADRLIPRPRETSSPSEVTTSPRDASAPANETGAPPQPGTGKVAGDARPGLGATARPSPSAPPRSNQAASVPPPGAATSNATSKQVVGAQRAELVGKPVSRGWGDSYAVRLFDSAGRPIVDANVRLVAKMADGTVENIAMGALAEPGTYRGTVSTERSTPVDLRVRVSLGEGFVEVPVSPSN